MKPLGETAIEKLLSVSSAALAPRPSSAPELLRNTPLGPELFRMLEMKNGFYAFESALHVFPLTSQNRMSLQEWNSESLWRSGYGGLTKGLLFFGEDVFQDQFCLSANGVMRFEAETGQSTLLAGSIEDWARILLSDYRHQTGWTLASSWQAANGPLRPSARLMPKTPFFLGGEYSLENLWAGDAVEGMRFKADLAMQTGDVPNGATVRLVVGKKPEVQ